VYSTNITPDKDTGIGNYSLQDFDNALRRGVAKNGGSLYPAMPYPSYSHLTTDDVAALYAYFEQGVAPIRQENRASDIPWPLSMRWPLTIWRWVFGPAVSHEDTSPLQSPNADQDAMMARGKYLVDGLGHCSACHTPRGIGMQEKAISANGGSAFLAGAEVDQWFAPSLRGEAVTGLGNWNAQEIAEFLKTGRTDKTAAFGGMTDVVVNSTQHMTDQDRLAIAHYLKSLAPASAESPISATTGDATTTALHDGQMSARGALIYANNCMACHKSNGQGYSQVFPALAANPVVNTANPNSLIHIVLAGSTLPATQTAVTSFHMPAFAYRLSDQDVADVVSFVRGGWGNQAPAVSVKQVAALRVSLHLPQH
jgi:mono/diheme cytochrome c family protein